MIRQHRHPSNTKMGLDIFLLWNKCGSMPWEVEHTDEFAEWYHHLRESEQDDVTVLAMLLMEKGPQLPFPHSSLFIDDQWIAALPHA
jgi:hypothetical protein